MAGFRLPAGFAKAFLSDFFYQKSPWQSGKLKAAHYFPPEMEV